MGQIHQAVLKGLQRLHRQGKSDSWLPSEGCLVLRFRDSTSVVVDSPFSYFFSFLCFLKDGETASRMDFKNWYAVVVYVAC